jgi:glycosyltransferase involved in cell wall biosynthesis
MNKRRSVLILGHNDGTQFIDIYNQYTQLFDPKHYDVTVAYLTGKAKEETKNRMLAENVIFLNITKSHIRGLKIKAIMQIRQFCRENQFDLIICHRYKPLYIMMWVAQFLRIPALIFVMHALGTTHALHRKLFIQCLNKKNMLFAGVSQAVKKDLENNLWGKPAKKVIHLYNSIDLEQAEKNFLSRVSGRTALGLPEESIIFGNAARLISTKNHASFIQAFAMIKPHCPLAKAVIIGNGELENNLKNLVKSLKLENDIIFTGFIPKASRYFKIFDCFVSNSTKEAFGLSILEAMAAKLPIIATRIGGIPEVVDNTGILIEANNIQTCANAMQEIYHATSIKKAQMGEEAYARVFNHFSTQAFKQNFWEQIHAHCLHHHL